MNRLEQEALIRAYVLAWLHNERKYLYEIMNLRVCFYHSSGAVYEDQGQLLEYFKDWQKYNDVTQWDIETFLHDEEKCAIKWVRTIENSEGKIHHQGMTYFRFAKGAIDEIHEYTASASYIYPYR